MALTTFVSGQVLTAAQLNDSYAAVGGLRLITAQTIGSAVTSVTVSNVFSSTYDNYKIIVSGGTGSVDNDQILIKLGATTTGYYGAASGVAYSTSAASLATNNNATAWSRFMMTQTNGICGNIDLIGPNLAKLTYIQGVSISDSVARISVGFLDNTTQYTDFTLTPESGGATLTGGTIYVYGYAKTN